MSAHAVLIHPSLEFSARTERTLALARAYARSGLRTTIVTSAGSRGRAFERAAQAEGFELVFGELPLQPARAPLATWRARRQLAQMRPDFLHGTSTALAALLAAVAPTLGVSYAVEVHHKPKQRLPRYAPRLGAIVIPSSELAAHVVNQGGVPREKIVLLPHAPEPRESAPQASSASADKRPLRVVCAGRLDEFHATSIFLTAARLLKKAGHDLQFALLGEGPRELEWRTWLRENELCEQVALSVPTTEDVAETLASFDIYVSCARQDGPDWHALLALQLGLPAIFSAAGESFRLVEDRKTGRLFERDDAQALADCIGAYAEDRELSRSHGRAAREAMRERCPVGTLAAGLEQVRAALAAPA